MQKLIRLLFITGALAGSLGAVSCQKSTVVPTEKTVSLAGTWVLTQTSDGIAGRIQPGDSSRVKGLVLDGNGQAQFLLNGTVTATTPYTQSQAIAATTGKAETFLTFSAIPTPRQYIAELSATTLLLADDNPDGLTTTY